MTYHDLYFLLDHIRFNVEQGNIELKAEVLKMCIEASSAGNDNILFWRFSQYDDALKYPELITLFKMKDFVFNEIQDTSYEEFLREIVEDFRGLAPKQDDYFKYLLNNKQAHLMLQQKINELAIIFKDRAKDLYDTLKITVGESIFEDIRYDLNPILGNHIIKLYNVMQNEIGNLYDKKTFINACHFENIDEIKLLINIILLGKHYGELDDLKVEIAEDVNEGQFRNLLILYETLLYRNHHFLDITDALRTIENNVEEKYDFGWIESIRNQIREVMPNPDPDAKCTFNQSKLYIILNGKEKLINIANTNDCDESEIQKHLKLSDRRLKNFGRIQ